jgi:hypothetical protein
MAVDYYHYLVVRGPAAAVRSFTDRIALVTTRRVAGVTQRQMVPFSFESLYAIAKIKDEPPCDPYDMTRWPIRLAQDARLGPTSRRARSGRGRRVSRSGAEVRYRFHTRNLPIETLIRKLSRAEPKLTFALVTHCLDGADFAAFTMAAGRRRGKWMGENWRESFWKRAATQLNMTLDEAFEDDEQGAGIVAEEMMLDAALEIAMGPGCVYNWSGGRVYRDLWEEREKQMREMLDSMPEEDEE